MAAKAVVLPEPFNGEASWEEWKLHFEDVAAVNEWTDDQKLKWLRVRLTGRAQKAFHRLPEEAQATYEGATIALQERFEPKSRKTRYQAEFETRRKKRSEGWADFAEDLRSLADKAFPELQAEAKECLALQTYLQQLEQPQVAFSVKQRRPATLDDAVAATLEMESYAVTFSRVGTVATLQEEEDRPAVGEGTATSTIATVDATSKLTTMLKKLMERVETLEKHQAAGKGGDAASLPQRRGRRREDTRVCWTCRQRGHIARNCPQGN